MDIYIVYLFQNLIDMSVRPPRVQFHLKDQPVQLVQDQDRFHALIPGLLEHNLGLRLNSFNYINNYDGSVAETNCCTDLG